MIRSMPSPKGTNHEKLFVLRGGGGGRAMAYDAASPAALASAHEDETVIQLVEWCQSNLRPEQMHALSEKLVHAVENADNRAQAQAHDALRGPYSPRPVYPSPVLSDLGKHIKVDSYGQQPPPKLPTPTGSQAQSFEDRYPEAARIKVGR